MWETARQETCLQARPRAGLRCFKATPESNERSIAGYLHAMANPPPVHLPGRDSDTGSLLAWRTNADGDKEYLVDWVPITDGYRGGLQEPRIEWLPASDVKQIAGQDYSTVPRQ